MNTLKRLVNFATSNSVLLFAGAVVAVLWANLHLSSYSSFRDASISIPWLQFNGRPVPSFGLFFLVNDVLMALFFALAAREVWLAMLPGGSLSTFRRGATPILCALGGMAGPALIYIAGALLLGRFSDLGRGWAIPCATDIAFSYMIARLVFGKDHPAIAFLLLLAIADDAFGLLVLALFYPVHPVHPLWLTLPVAAVLLGLLMRRWKIRSFWWYLLIPGPISWIGLSLAGIHPALALLPIIPTLPHGRHGDRVPHWGPVPGRSALDRLQAFWARPVELIIGLFALMNAGVALTAVAAPTFLVLVGLLAGKPLGIFLTAVIAVRYLGLHMDAGIGRRELIVTGCAAGIGFTVALFVITVAFSPGPIQDAAKVGALASCLAAVVAVVVARLTRMPRCVGTAE